MLTVIDEFTHESLAIKTKRQLNSTDVSASMLKVT